MQRSEIRGRCHRGATGADHEDASVRFDELVRPLLVANHLTDAIEIALERSDGDDEFGLKTFEFAGSTGYLAAVRSPRHPVALLERLIAVLVDVSAESVNFR